MVVQLRGKELEEVRTLCSFSPSSFTEQKLVEMARSANRCPSLSDPIPFTTQFKTALGAGSILDPGLEQEVSTVALCCLFSREGT